MDLIFIWFTVLLLGVAVLLLLRDYRKFKNDYNCHQDFVDAQIAGIHSSNKSMVAQLSELRKTLEPQQEETEEEKKRREANERLGKDIGNMLSYNPYEVFKHKGASK